jgi:YHS domain-containing protein
MTMSQKVICPVCNQEVPQDMLAVEYAGERYAFCCPHCRARFIEDCELEFIQSSGAARGSPESGE